MSLAIAGPSDCDALAAIHAVCMALPWQASAIRDMLESTFQFAIWQRDAGFILMRCVATEAEVLTLGVAPTQRRNGLGALLLGAGLNEAIRRGALGCFLEVDVENRAALALYRQTCFRLTGRRCAYYEHAHRAPTDALIMMRALDPISP